MERIEQHALDDHTIAAVGSSESFSAAAKFASTPYNLTGKLGDQSSSASQSHLSHLSHITSKSTHTSDITQSSNVTHMSSVTQPQNFDMTTLSKKGLRFVPAGLPATKPAFISQPGSLCQLQLYSFLDYYKFERIC